MKFNYIKKIDKTEIILEEEDLCDVCGLAEVCPLMHGLANNVVLPRFGNMVVGDCVLYDHTIEGKEEEE